MYTHTATTLKDDNSYIVLFQNQVKAASKFVDYQDYKGVPKEVLEDSSETLEAVDEDLLPLEGPFFNLIKTKVGEN